jgi:hypothetical protein
MEFKKNVLYYRVNCSEAHHIEIPISYSVRKELKWPEWKRSLR